MNNFKSIFCCSVLMLSAAILFGQRNITIRPSEKTSEVSEYIDVIHSDDKGMIVCNFNRMPEMAYFHPVRLKSIKKFDNAYNVIGEFKPPKKFEDEKAEYSFHTTYFNGKILVNRKPKSGGSVLFSVDPDNMQIENPELARFEYAYNPTFFKSPNQEYIGIESAYTMHVFDKDFNKLYSFKVPYPRKGEVTNNIKLSELDDEGNFYICYSARSKVGEKYKSKDMLLRVTKDGKQLLEIPNEDGVSNFNWEWNMALDYYGNDSLIIYSVLERDKGRYIDADGEEQRASVYLLCTEGVNRTTVDLKTFSVKNSEIIFHKDSIPEGYGENADAVTGIKVVDGNVYFVVQKYFLRHSDDDVSLNYLLPSKRQSYGTSWLEHHEIYYAGDAFVFCMNNKGKLIWKNKIAIKNNPLTVWAMDLDGFFVMESDSGVAVLYNSGKGKSRVVNLNVYSATGEVRHETVIDQRVLNKPCNIKKVRGFGTNNIVFYNDLYLGKQFVRVKWW